jgi:hypothetical protein
MLSTASKQPRYHFSNHNREDETSDLPDRTVVTFATGRPNAYKQPHFGRPPGAFTSLNLGICRDNRAEVAIQSSTMAI